MIYELSINGASTFSTKKNYVRAEVLLSAYLIIPEGPHVFGCFIDSLRDAD